MAAGLKADGDLGSSAYWGCRDASESDGMESVQETIQVFEDSEVSGVDFESETRRQWRRESGGAVSVGSTGYWAYSGPTGGTNLLLNYYFLFQ